MNAPNTQQAWAGPSLALVNLEAEAALLGALLIDNRLIDTIPLGPSDFGEPVHGRIFEAICSTVAEGKAANPATLARRLADDTALQEIGGPGYLATLTANTSALLAADSLAAEVRDLAQRRQLHAAATEAAQLLLSPCGDTAAALATLDAARAAATQSMSEKLEVLEVGDWQGTNAPPRPWIVDGWLPSRAVTLIAGEGGTGKSLMVQQWLSCLAAGLPFIGIDGARPVRCLYVNCEDPADELHRRQEAIARALGRPMATFGSDMAILPRVGAADNALGTFEADGRFVRGRLFAAIRDYCLKGRIRVLALDNVAHLFTGNENSRGNVTAFLNALSSLALEIDGAVILVGHPAKATDSEYSGSTAWENAVRNRLFLSRPKEAEGNDAEPRRELSRNKANLAAIGEKIVMTWHAGAFHAERDLGAAESQSAAHEAAFLRCLDRATEQRRNVSHSPGKNYAPAVFAKMPQAAGIGPKALEAAMGRLFSSGQIVANQELWRHERRRAPVHGLARTNARTTPAQTTARTAHQPRTNPAQTRTQTPLYTTYISGGALDPPAGQGFDDGQLADEAP